MRSYGGRQNTTPWLRDWAVDQLQQSLRPTLDAPRAPPPHLVQILSRGGEFWSSNDPLKDAFFVVSDGVYWIEVKLTKTCRQKIWREVSSSAPVSEAYIFLGFSRGQIGLISNYTLHRNPDDSDEALFLKVDSWIPKPGIDGLLVPAGRASVPLDDDIDVRMCLQQPRLGDVESALLDDDLFDQIMAKADIALLSMSESNVPTASGVANETTIFPNDFEDDEDDDEEEESMSINVMLQTQPETQPETSQEPISTNRRTLTHATESQTPMRSNGSGSRAGHLKSSSKKRRADFSTPRVSSHVKRTFRSPTSSSASPWKSPGPAPARKKSIWVDFVEQLQQKAKTAIDFTREPQKYSESGIMAHGLRRWLRKTPVDSIEKGDLEGQK